MPTCKGQHPDGSPCRNRTPAGETHCYIHRRLEPGAFLAEEDVLAAIKETGGPNGLDLSHEDLGALNVLWDADEHVNSLHPPVYYLVGINLSGANLLGAHLDAAILEEASLQETNLHGASLEMANLWGACLENADLRGTNLRDAKLYRCHLQGANLSGADLSEADLRESRLERVDLTEVRDLTGVRWYGAFLEKTRLRREQLGEKIGDELTAERGEGTYDDAREAYLALKTNFNELGRYDDASWAYRRERRMERATDYGESPGRVLGWAALLLLVVYPFIYWWCAGRPAPAGDLLAFAKDYLLLSLGSFSTLDLADLSAANTWTRLWAASEAMLGISLLALLMFTLGNRISRS